MVLDDSEKKWESVKPLIESLYMDQNKTLKQVQRDMKDLHSFAATWVSLFS